MKHLHHLMAKIYKMFVGGKVKTLQEIVDKQSREIELLKASIAKYETAMREKDSELSNANLTLTKINNLITDQGFGYVNKMFVKMD